MSAESPGRRSVRVATGDDADAVARMLDAFNREFDEPTPGVAFLTGRVGGLIGAGEITVLLAGEEPHGLAVMYTRPSLWEPAPDAYLAELYVAPEHRGRGSGRALLESTMQAARRAGATHIELITAVTDTAARGLYESSGFTNRDKDGAGDQLLYYEREL